jgi:indole-3-glycerol phosphate synthase
LNLLQSIKLSQARKVVPILAEIKRIIPKLADEYGRPRDKRDAGQLAGLYEAGGAAGISVVTELQYFGGNPEKDIPAVLQATSLPLLVKDFILDVDKVDFYKEITEKLGAGFTGRVTLLLHAHMLRNKLSGMLEYIYSCGMHALVETRGVQDLYFLRNMGKRALMIGINNKDIDELEMGEDQLRITPDMIAAYRAVVGDALIISQSAHHNINHIRRAVEAGADAVLVGTALMLSRDPTGMVSSFAHAGGMDK